MGEVQKGHKLRHMHDLCRQRQPISMPDIRVEYAKSGRSRCVYKTCSTVIEKDEVRVGPAVLMPGADTPSYKWRHLCCFTARQIANVKSIDDIEGLDDLSKSDQALVKRMLAKELIDDFSIRGCTGSSTASSAKPKKPATPKVRVEEPDDDDDEEDVISRWEVKLEGGFSPIDEKIAAKIEAAYAAEISSIELTMGDWAYTIDLDNMTQTNKKTKRTRDLRRVTEAAPAPSKKFLWEWKNDEGSFVEYSAADTKALEEAFEKVGAATFKVKMRGYDYLFNFKDWTQLNLGSGVPIPCPCPSYAQQLWCPFPPPYLSLAHIMRFPNLCFPTHPSPMYFPYTVKVKVCLVPYLGPTHPAHPGPCYLCSVYALAV